MLAALGDLIEDVVVRLAGPIRHAGDTEANVSRRRGGSAANVCAAAASLGHPTRLIAQVGDDHIGRSLVDGLERSGVDTEAIGFAGDTGTIIVLVDELGERTMLTDRRSALSLGPHDPRWLDGVDTLHVPFYSLTLGRLAETARATIADARRLGIAVSIDVSSVTELDRLGIAGARAVLTELAPTVIFANADEAAALAIDGPVGGSLTVVKRGPRSAIVHRPDGTTSDVPALEVAGAVDTTGAGDAFAAGFLTAVDRSSDPDAACAAGHAAAAAVLRSRAIC